jgi:hypothetical protein
MSVCIISGLRKSEEVVNKFIKLLFFWLHETLLRSDYITSYLGEQLNDLRDQCGITIDSTLQKTVLFGNNVMGR